MDNKKFLEQIKYFEPDEIEMLCRIAQNHNVSVQMIGKKITGQNVRPQVLLDESELEIVKQRVELHRMDRSAYCIACAKYAIKNEYFSDEERVLHLLRYSSRRGYQRNNRVVIAFSSTNDLEDITNYASKLSVGLAAFLRYTALYIDLPF